MLRAIHALIERLGLFEECLEGAVVEDSARLYQHPASYYHRADLLPALESNETLRERFFGGARKPIFTSSSADNHLVTFSEVMAMYLLVWSPVPWTLIDPQPPELTAERRQRYDLEQQRIEAFPRHYPWIPPEGLDYIRALFATLGLDITGDDLPPPKEKYQHVEPDDGQRLLRVARVLANERRDRIAELLRIVGLRPEHAVRNLAGRKHEVEAVRGRHRGVGSRGRAARIRPMRCETAQSPAQAPAPP